MNENPQNTLSVEDLPGDPRALVVRFREDVSADQMVELGNELRHRQERNGMGAAHADALQRIGSQLGLFSGSDLHKDCLPAIQKLMREHAAYQRAIKEFLRVDSMAVAGSAAHNRALAALHLLAYPE